MANLKDRVQRIAEGNTGRGLNIFSDDLPRLTYTRLEDIEVDPDQPRKDMGDIEGLQLSIQEHGIVQPLVVSPLENNRFRLVAGERRFTAARALNLVTVPTIVRTVQDHQRLELQIIENLHRKDLNPLEEARSYQRLQIEFGMTQDQVAQQVGKSKAAINQILRILDLPVSVKEEIQTSEHISKSVLLEIAKQPTEERQMALWNQAKSGELTVKKAREQKRDDAGKAILPVPSAPRQAAVHLRYPIHTQLGTVTIFFEQADATQEDIVATLREALEAEEARLHAINS